LAVHAVPRASRSEIVGLHGEAVRVRLQSPPVEGKANKALLELLAKELGVARRSVTLSAGDSARSKVVHIAGLTPAEVLKRLGL